MANTNRKDDNAIFRIPPYYYIHVLDQNTNVTKIEIGPQTYIRQDNQRVTLGPEKMVVVPPRHYCVIENPVSRDKDGKIVVDALGQIKLQHADQEIRLTQDPFPLYPGEVLKEAVTALKVVPANTALRIRAILDFDDGDVRRTAGDEWLFEGPGTYIPRKECHIEETVRATVIGPNQAIRLRARKECEDRDKVPRVTGEEWLVKKTGAYLPGAYEEVVDIVNAYVLTEKKALHMRSLRTFKDDFGIIRKNGEEWLITMKDTETHIPNVYEEVVGVVNITTLNNRQYCIILDPVDSQGKPQLGQKKLVKGEKSFFLMPGEKLEKGIQNVYILGEDEGLILRANETFDDGDTSRSPGDRWMIRGPKEYVPPVEVEVVMKRQAIPLDENEGIYVRDIKTGKVRAIQGETYMISQDEELWAKELPPTVESLLAVDHMAERSERKADAAPKPRDKTRVVSFRVPHNAAVQIYDYKEKKARVVFGPELVMLGPDEQFTQLSLSGGKPKKPNVIKSLCLLLGPDFCTDIIVVETADHARLSLQLSYNWHFECPERTPVESAKLFSVPDFTGDACKAIASRVRGAVAQVQFDDFHKNSAKIIRASVFGIDANGKVRDKFHFPQNNLVITSIDIQSVEPVDQRTRDALQKSVQLAIEITTNSQEATARHEAERLEQEAKGRLERQKISDEAEAEKARKELLELQANSAAVESTGQAKAEAQSRAEASRIEGEAAVEQARLKAQATKIEAESELERLTNAREAELKYVCEQNKMELEKSSELTTIEVNKFKEMVSAIGAQTLLAMATAGPDMQVRMLKALGLRSTLITDGSSPINLFNTASGLIGGLVPSRGRQSEEETED
ncbi:major vault protein-like isoform X2 [Physella acuta]|nr:major vault protein-like isoform X2 [Physella acuta]XP_059146177.1 major vault protein-like isoform X2 [Physella acuta]XP_059146178.1 major vault protein-like isoform X2 [Physella acuta]